MSSSGNFILISLPDYTNRCLNKKIYIKKKSLQLVFHARKNNNNRKEVAGGGGVAGRLLF